MRDARIVHEHVETAELKADTLCRSVDGGLICDVELEGARVRSDAFRSLLPILKAARPNEYDEAMCREFFGNLKTDSFVGPGNQGDGFILHLKNLLSCIEVRYL